MEFKLVNEASLEFGHISRMINDMSNSLNDFFSEKDFGEDIKSIIVCVISVSPEFESFMKPKPPKYSKGKQSIINQGVKVDVSNSLRFDIKIEFDALKNIDNKEDLTIIIYDKILSNLHLIEDFKIKKFDVSLYKMSLKEFFEPRLRKS